MYGWLGTVELAMTLLQAGSRENVVYKDKSRWKKVRRTTLLLRCEHGKLS